ncbi:MAG: hypothetical protein V4736_00510 [Bdellovibrionota bacterium]
MKKMMMVTLMTLICGSIANAGSSVTTLACSSESGRTVISGILPGQGEMAVALNFSVASDMIMFSNSDDYVPTTAEVDLNAKNQTVRIEVKNKLTQLKLVSSSAKLTSSSNGTKGSFVGQVTGTHPSNWEPIAAPIVVRCFVSDEI